MSKLLDIAMDIGATAIVIVGVAEGVRRAQKAIAARKPNPASDAVTEAFQRTQQSDRRLVELGKQLRSQTRQP